RAALPAHRAVPGRPGGGDRARRRGDRARGRGERARRRGAVPGVSGGPSAGTLRRDAALTAVLAAIGVLAVWWVFVTTALGQQVESTALEGSRIGRRRLSEGSQTVLDVVSVPFLIVVIVVGVAVALLQRQGRVALAVPLLVGGA